MYIWYLQKQISKFLWQKHVNPGMAPGYFPQPPSFSSSPTIPEGGLSNSSNIPFYFTNISSYFYFIV